MKKEIKKLTLLACICLILLPAEKVLGAEQTVSVSIPVEQQFETSGRVPEDTFVYELTGLGEEIVMPENGGDRTWIFSMEGNETAEIGPVTFRHGGIYRYELRQLVEQEEEGYSYDCQVYEITVYVTNQPDGTLGAQVIVETVTGEKLGEICFQNRYTGAAEEVASVRTGDAGESVLWALLLVISGAAAWIAYKKRAV